MRQVAILFMCLMAALILTTYTTGAAPATGPVYVIRIDGAIDRMNQQYLEHSLDEAEAQNARAFIIEMDTPGGYGSAMDAMTRRMLAAKVPTVVYVSPAGAGAGSAGVFIAMSADVVAMAPGTRIGAAHPVDSSGNDIQGDMRDKVTNYYAAAIRSMASQKGHNAVWAEQAVRQSVSLTDQEALQQKVINLIAANRDDLLRQINGMQVTTAAGPVTINVDGAPVETHPMNWMQQILRFIINPDIAYLLLLVAIIGIVTEFVHPGALVPGIAGSLSFLLFLIATESMPLNWGGLALIALAAVLVIMETQIASHGALSIGALIAFLLGSLILFSPFTPQPPDSIWYAPVEVNRWLIAGSTAVMAGGLFAIATMAINVRRRKPVSGVQALIGQEGLATSSIPVNGVGTVLVQSEEWTAVTSEEPIHEGERVVITAIEGLKLRVQRVSSTDDVVAATA